MVRTRRHRGHKGIIGTSMTGVQGRRKPPAQRNNQTCPVCLSVAQQPCMSVLSKPGAAVLRLGPVMATMHPQRPGAAPAQPRSRQTQRTRTTRQPDAAPVPIEKIHADRSGFVPRNQRAVEIDEQGRARTRGWSRDNQDAIPHRVKEQP
jgi:hypothetical protein